MLTLPKARSSEGHDDSGAGGTEEAETCAYGGGVRTRSDPKATTAVWKVSITLTATAISRSPSSPSDIAVAVRMHTSSRFRGCKHSCGAYDCATRR